jgi:hypothetical protein
LVTVQPRQRAFDYCSAVPEHRGVSFSYLFVCSY